MLNRHVSERGDWLTLLTWLMWQTVLKHVVLMKTKRSTLKTKHFVRERKDPMVNEADMDFRIPGLPHPVVRHAQSTSVRELIQQIGNHPDQHALQQDLRQNQSFNPFSPESKQMIQNVGNIELCESLELEPKTPCTACLSYWNTGMIYCTCGHFLHKETRVNRKFVKYTMDLLSVPEYIIKKRRCHGHREGKKAGRQIM